jgi:catechol 2,3-dioxygenase-like lactoylglutathione lyase family enzyme
VSARLVLTILAVRDLAVSRAFHEAVLGWPAVVETPVYVELRDEGGMRSYGSASSAGGMRLGLYQRDGFGRNVGQAPMEAPAGALHAAEVYFAVSDPREAVERALAHGGRLLSPVAPRDWGDEVGYVADPDGHVVAFARLGA